MFGDLPPYWPPGEKCWYSNAGYILLGILLEEVTGRPYTELVQQCVFDRAGMAASGFWRLDEVVPDLATNYVRQQDGSWRTNHYSVPVIGGADGGAQVTARDADRFMTALDDGTLLGDLHDVMLQPHADYEEGLRFGYGVMIYPDGRFGHGGGDPGVDVLVHRWPEEKTNLVVLANVEGPHRRGPRPGAGRLARLALRSLRNAGEPLRRAGRAARASPGQRTGLAEDCRARKAS